MADRSVLSAALTLSHFGALFLVLGWGLWPMRRDREASICAVFVLVWTTFVCTALLLASVSRLGDRLAYVAVSLLLAVVFATLLRWSWSRDRELRTSALAAAPPDRLTRSGRSIRGMFWLAIVAVVIPTAGLCVGFDPDNYDSVAYRLPRALLYIGQSTLHLLPGGDFRLQLYPFDATLAYLATAIHGLAGRWMNLFGFVTWLVGAVAVNRTARDCGAGQTEALFAATLYLTTPAVLISAASTNDDMIAGVPLLIGLMFGMRWWRSAALADGALMAMGVGLSAGSKLHFPFLMPVALLFLAFLLYRLVRQGRFIRCLRKRALQASAAFAIMAALSVPSIVINLIEAGHATPDLPNFANRPFSPAVAGINTVLFSANLFLAPIPDLDLDASMAGRKAVYDAFNGWLNRHLFGWVSPTLNYSNEPIYRFEGVASNDAYWGLWEQSAWMGFLPWLALAIPFLAWSRGAPTAKMLRTMSVWLAAAFFGWHLARCLTLKYVGGAGIYYAFIAALLAPAFAWLWNDAARSRTGQIVVRTACLAVLITNLIYATNTFMFNVQRNIPELLHLAGRQPRATVVGPDLAAVLKAGHRTLIAYTEWELPLLDLMSVQPKARYALTGGSLSAGPVPGYDLSLMLQRVRADYGELPLQFAHDDRKRLAVLGRMLSVYGDQNALGHRNLTPPPPSPPAETVASYSAATDSGSLRLAEGWSISERTHRWSNATDSSIDFDIPSDGAACDFNVTAITLGPQRITAKLNGHAIGTLLLKSWFPGMDATLSLPDDATIRGSLNHLSLHYDMPQSSPSDPRPMAVGIVKAAVACHHDARPAQSMIFAYSAATDQNTGLLTRGWSASERTHRWSDAAESDLEFRTPHDAGGCTLEAKVITAGEQRVTTLLNGQAIGTATLHGWFPGQDFHLRLPDAALHLHVSNKITFRYAQPRTFEGRNLALGLISAGLRCGAGATHRADLPPLAREGFAVLGIDERRDAMGGLTGLMPNRLNGVDPDEAFDIAVSVKSLNGNETEVKTWRPVAWSTWIDIPSAPKDGAIRIGLRRRDRREIKAEIYLPVTPGSSLGLDLRSPPDASGKS